MAEEISKKELNEMRAGIIYMNYLGSCGKVLTGPEKRKLRRKILHDVAIGKYDKMFDSVANPKSTAAGRDAFSQLNGDAKY